MRAYKGAIAPVMPSTPSKASSRATASDALSAVADGLNRVDLEDPSLEIPRAMTRNVLSAAIRLTSFEGPIHSIGYKCWTRENKVPLDASPAYLI